MNPTKVNDLSVRCLLSWVVIEVNPLTYSPVSHILSGFEDPQCLSMLCYFTLTFLETETPVLPPAWAGVTLCVSLGSFLYKLGMCKSGTACAREGWLTSPIRRHRNAHFSPPSEGGSCHTPEQPRGTGEPPWGLEAPANDTQPPGCGYGLLCQGCTAGCLCVGRFGCPLLKPGLPGRAVPVGFKETTIYLFSEASLFCCFWQLQLSSGCGYVSVIQRAICLPEGPGWFTSKATDSVRHCRSLDFTSGLNLRNILCCLHSLAWGEPSMYFFPFPVCLECLFTIELCNTSAISLTLLISPNEDCFCLLFSCCLYSC